MNKWPLIAFQAAVVLSLLACSNEYVTRPTPAERASIAADNVTLTLGFLGGPCDQDGEVAISETPIALKIDLRVRVKTKDCARTDEGVPYGVTVKLKSPLGGKTLLTGEGQPIRLTPQERSVPLPARKVSFTK